MQKYLLKRSYNVAKKNIILCIWCNAICLMQFKVQKHYFPHTVYNCCFSVPFWNVSIFTKLIVLRSDACSDWPAIQCIVIQVWDANVMPLTVLWCRVVTHKNTASPGHGAEGSNNTTARIIVLPSFIVYTFGRCLANLPAPWRRHVGACLNELF